ncbi:MAG TPA: serine/threonine-protein kinase [Ktedonobacteraceae bacterium]
MTDHSGQQLGNYHLLRLLGQGGFADVYLGEHVYLNTQAAIKVLHTQLTQDMRVHFLGEAQTIARLRHPHIVRVLDFGVENMIPFLVMEYAPNGTLRQLYPRGSRLSLPLIVSYIKQIAGALQHAHDQRLIHRDVKPENMLLGQNNQVLLSDFGIATIAHTSHSLHTQDFSGTIAYMAPEQIQGKSRPASDQYALAVISYEWLTGHCPFQGSFAEIASQHMFAPIPPLQTSYQALPPDVERVLRMALAKDPEVRFVRVEAYASALEQACQPGLSTLPIALPNLLPPSSAASILISVPPTKPSPSIAPLNTDPPNMSPPVSYQSTPGVAPHSPSHTPPTSPPETMIPAPISRGISRRSVLGSLLGIATVVAGGGITWFTIEHLHSSAASPTVVAQPTAKPTQQPGTPVTNKPLIHQGPDKEYTVSWSPDGAKIASAGNGEIIEVWDPVTGTSLFNLVSGAGTVFSVAWSPDGTKIASGQKDGTVKIWDTMNGHPYVTYTGHTGFVVAVAWSPHGQYMASGGVDTTVQVWKAIDGTLISTYTGHSAEVEGLSWSSDSKRVASASDDKTVQLW